MTTETTTFDQPALLLAYAPSGYGKCLAPETPVLRYDGTIVAAEEVVKGDLLMGPDSRPRKVTSICRGESTMYRITPVKGDSWVCNDVHVLTLFDTETKKTHDIALPDFLKRSPAWQARQKLFQPGPVSFPGGFGPPPIDAYFIGVWYGDGLRSLDGIQVSKPDKEIEDACRSVAETWGLKLTITAPDGKCPRYAIVGEHGWINPLLKKMHEVIGDASRIPHAYLTAAVQDRLRLLAGLLDTDGSLNGPNTYEITQDRKGIATDIAFLARSLGFRVTHSIKTVKGKEYQRLQIMGETSIIPCRIARKRAQPRKQIKDARRVGFTVQKLRRGPYAGFTLDGDGRFLLGDFTVTHNTTDLVLSFPRFLFICQPGGLLPAETVAGYRPNQIRTAKTFDDLIAIVEQEKKKQAGMKDKLWDGIVVDDWSLMSDTSLAKLEENYPTTSGGKKDTNAFWGNVRRILLKVRDTLRFSDFHMVCNAHERGPHTDERKGYIPGGPMLPGTMPADMPKTFDAVLRVVPVEGVPVWPFAYRADENDTSWVTKNRFALYGDLPMNLGEMLRMFYGTEGRWGIRRLASMPWQEEMVEKVARALAPYEIGTDEHRAMRQRCVDSMRKKHPEATDMQIAWTLRDGMHRAIFRALRQRGILSRYGVA